MTRVGIGRRSLSDLKEAVHGYDGQRPGLGQRFMDATFAQICRVEVPSDHHLYWPGLDIDLAVESIEHPERYPLVSKVLNR